jgi:hypothetical protein
MELAMPLAHKEEEIAMLRTEIEILVQERSKLLRVAGAAAVFIANTDIHHLPKHVVDAADILVTSVNMLPEDTLRDALESVHAQVELDTPERRKRPRE